MTLGKASVGIYENFLEYRRMIYRRLFLGTDFTEKEAINIGRILENENDFNCYRVVRTKKKKFYVYIGNFGEIYLPLNKNGKKIRTSNLEEIIKK